MADNYVGKLLTELTEKTTATDTDLVPVAEKTGTLFRMTLAKLKEIFLGTKDISGIGDGTVKGAISELNTKIGNRIVTSRYFAGTYNNTSYVFVSLSDMGITGKKLHQFPSILATLNTDVNGMYIEKAFRNSDESIAIIFNKAYSGSFIIALSFDVIDS